MNNSIIKNGDYVLFNIRLSTKNSTGIAKINRKHNRDPNNFIITLIYCNKKFKYIDYNILHITEIDRIIKSDDKLSKWLELLYG